MENLLTPMQGWIAIFAFGLLMISVTLIFGRRHRDSKEQFLVAGREVAQWQAALSISATWIWAPALFISAQKAYEQGIVGVFWFTVPNIATIVLFGYFAANIRKKMPFGFTLSGFIREKYSSRTQSVYIFQLLGLSICCFAVQLLAGGLILSQLTGISFLSVTVAMSVIVLIYSAFGGLRASVITDNLQMILISLVGFIFIPWAVWKAGGCAAISAGLYGKSGTYHSLWAGDGLDTFFSFGIPVTLGLFAGPFGDQAFWQRAFAIRERDVKSAFIKGALIFATVPLLMCLLGFVAAGDPGFTAGDVQTINLQVIVTYLPFWAVIPFVYMLLSGLTSTLDSCCSAVSSISGHDLLEMSGKSRKHSVRIARISMVGLAALALCIANIPGMKILYLFLFYGTLRASTLLPTIFSLVLKNINEAGMFWGVVTSLTIGLPIFAYGKLCGNLPAILFGSVFSVAASGIIVLASSLFLEKRRGSMLSESKIENR
jgi:urea-proton symporter